MSSPAAPDADPQDRSAAGPAASASSEGDVSTGRAPNSRVTTNRVTAFLRSPAGNAAVLGTCGSILMTFGSFGAGSVRRKDPLLEEMFLSWLRFGHGQLLSVIILWVGVLIMIGAWVRVGRATLAGTVGLRDLWTMLPAWTAPLLVATPMFSRDAYSYLAQGAMLRAGFDPYTDGPVVNPGVLLDNVSNVWTTTTTPYGPVHLLLGSGITALTGDNVVSGTWLWRITMLPGLFLMAWAVPKLARRMGGNPAIALWLAVLNPLVLIHLVGGVHNELLMVGLMTAGIVLVLQGRHMGGIALVSLGAAIKATAGLALPFLIWVWMIHERDRALAEGREPAAPVRSFFKAVGAGFAVFVAVFGGASLLAGVGIGWLTALSGSSKIINWLSVPTVIAHVGTWITPWRLGSILDITRMLCALALVAILAWAWWRFRRTERDAVLGIVVALTAVTLLSPAALPWYYSWPLAVAAAFALSTRSLMILVGLSTWLMLIFNPDGSIGMYNLAHVALAVVAAVIAARSLTTRDPLRLGSRPKPAHDTAAPGKPAHDTALPDKPAQAVRED
ncbi:alpha-(1-_6)-mannopyranosyltransferase A [Rhodococcus coprophilus]|uniref:Alpha-(1->6)-mannopyranosyltransferase A n=1 Tax=Rhodococcus coprophilus TaxID=38310 RepID=A0A2X4TLL1_9NOCA|nr:alpha-(1->6)-mannopyranosyltransferase A [Rhodococcus coprophilus]MBM7460476.1 alpha-1,6-mannosyltransferase [Rhodococcus coprophilus]SQI28286.1 mannosyltransferase MptA [Rhodococcus coprophilus]